MKNVVKVVGCKFCGEPVKLCVDLREGRFDNVLILRQGMVRLES